MCKVKRGESGFKLLLHSQQKSIAQMKQILQKRTKPGNLVMDACSGTFSVANSCLRNESDIAGGEQVRNSVKVCVKIVELIEVQKLLRAWKVRKGYLPMRTFPPHILHHPSKNSEGAVVPNGNERFRKQVEQKIVGETEYVRPLATAFCSLWRCW